MEKKATDYHKTQHHTYHTIHDHRESTEWQMKVKGDTTPSLYLQLLSKCVMAFQSHVNGEEKCHKYDPSYCKKHNPVPSTPWFQ